MTGWPDDLQMPDFLAVGASVRALLESVVRSGGSCGAVDLFADRDTKASARFVQRVDRLSGIPDALRREASVRRPPVVLCAGGIENQPALLESLGEIPGLLLSGCHPDCLKKVRDPFFVHDALQSAGLPALAVSRDYPGRSRGAWIAKPRNSAGGTRVFRMDTDLFPVVSGDHYFQEFVEGVVCGASLVANPHGVELMGVCRQLASSSLSVPFRYEGSVGPVPNDETLHSRLLQIGNRLAGQAGLSGWFGIDFIVRDAAVLVLEVNPRYTASMEILDGRTAPSLLARHLQASGLASCDTLPRRSDLPATNGVFAGKQILFNNRDADLTIDPESSDRMWAMHQDDSRPVRDVPLPGTVIPPGGPVCTVWSEADSMPHVYLQLDKQKQAVTALLK